MEKREQRGPLAASGHVAFSKMRNHAESSFVRDAGRIPELEGRREIRVVRNSLAVIGDHVGNAVGTVGDDEFTNRFSVPVSEITIDREKIADRDFLSGKLKIEDALA